MLNCSDMDRVFPRYERFDPRVPVWCVTPKVDRCIHRFFDTSPIDPRGGRLVVTRLPYEDRAPSPGDVAEVIVIDLSSGATEVVAQTRGWEPQMGANVNWAGDGVLVFNDVEPGEWEPFAVRLDLETGEKTRLGGTVYHASPDGRFAASSCMKRMGWTQGGYGVVIPESLVETNIGLRDDDGLTLTDIRTGEAKLVASLKRIVETAGPDELRERPDGFAIYGFHAKFNGRGDRLIYTLRWFEHHGETPTIDRGGMRRNLRFAVYTLKPDGSDIRLAVPPDRWEKGGHHINFYPDGDTLSMNLGHFGGLQLVRCGADGSGLEPMMDITAEPPPPPGSGHPTVHRDNRHVLTDTYTHEPTAFGDGTIPLRWIDLHTASEQTLVRVNTKTPCPLQVMRVDPHPAWDATWKFAAFNAFVDGTRRVYIADLSSLIAEPLLV